MRNTTIILLFLAIVATAFGAELQIRPHFHPLRFDLGSQTVIEDKESSFRFGMHSEMSFPRVRFGRRAKVGLSHFVGLVKTNDKNAYLNQTMFNGGTGIKYFGRNMSYFRIGALRGKNDFDQTVKGHHLSLGIAPGNKSIGFETSYQKLGNVESVSVSAFVELYDLVHSVIWAISSF